jgi:hypothetical protein
LEQPEISWPNASPLPYPNMSPNQPKGTNPDSIAAIVQNFKFVSTRRINQWQQDPLHPNHPSRDY